MPFWFKDEEKITAKKANRLIALMAIVISLFTISLVASLFLTANYLSLRTTVAEIIVDNNTQDTKLLTHSTEIVDLVGIMDKRHIQTEKQMSRLGGMVEVLDSSIDPDRKRWARVVKVRDAIRDTYPNRHPLPGCPDKPTPAFLLKTAAYMVDYSDRYGIPVSLTMAVARRESYFCQTAKSSAGAYGMMQLMSGTADDISSELGSRLKRHRTRDNIHMGAYYLSKMLGDFRGDLELAVKAYNAGPIHVMRVRAGEISDYYKETREYAEAVLRYEKEFAELGLK